MRACVVQRLILHVWSYRWRLHLTGWGISPMSINNHPKITTRIYFSLSKSILFKHRILSTITIPKIEYVGFVFRFNCSFYKEQYKIEIKPKEKEKNNNNNECN
jgi:hypothetical protein